MASSWCFAYRLGSKLNSGAMQNDGRVSNQSARLLTNTILINCVHYALLTLGVYNI